MEVTDTLHERVTEDATDSSITMAMDANGVRDWPAAIGTEDNYNPSIHERARDP